MSYDRALKILSNRKKYSIEEIREAIGVYHSVNRLSRCPVCNNYKLHSHGNTPCLDCLRHYSTKLNHYYER